MKDFGLITFLMERKQTSIRLDAQTLKKLKILAVESDKSLNEILLEAIQDLLKKYGKPKK
jgi:predicted transcriptional regulator